MRCCCGVAAAVLGAPWAAGVVRLLLRLPLLSVTACPRVLRSLADQAASRLLCVLLCVRACVCAPVLLMPAHVLWGLRACADFAPQTLTHCTLWGHALSMPPVPRAAIAAVT
jgi:hypothetical protein